MTSEIIDEISKILILKTHRRNRFQVLAYQDPETGDKFVLIDPIGFNLCKDILTRYSYDNFDLESLSPSLKSELYEPIELEE